LIWIVIFIRTCRCFAIRIFISLSFTVFYHRHENFRWRSRTSATLRKWFRLTWFPLQQSQSDASIDNFAMCYQSCSTLSYAVN
jgi:hypothetical protein